MDIPRYMLMSWNKGISDYDVLDLANREGAVLLTADKDFGELVFRQDKVARDIVVRLAGLPPAIKAEIIAATIKDRGVEFLSSFTVIAPGSVRIRQKVFYDL